MVMRGGDNNDYDCDLGDDGDGSDYCGAEFGSDLNVGEWW